MPKTGADGWYACDENDGANASGNVTAVTGPATPPLGVGSAQFTVANTGDGPYLWTSYENGLRLDDITTLTYNQY